jgi:hypothetical protein
MSVYYHLSINCSLTGNKRITHWADVVFKDKTNQMKVHNIIYNNITNYCNNNNQQQLSTVKFDSLCSGPQSGTHLNQKKNQMLVLILFEVLNFWGVGKITAIVSASFCYGNGYLASYPDLT